MWPFLKKRVPSLRVRIWNDPYPYKKTFVIQGFYDLACDGLVDLRLEPYEYFRSLGAPEPVGPPYRSHKNIVILVIEDGSRFVKVVYDANDIYYKIPNSLLRWCDLYFKSSFQQSYLSTGELLGGGFWGTLPFVEAALPEPLDLAHSTRFRPASFSMELFASYRKNRRFFAKWKGAWLKTSPSRKKNDVFFLGRYWGDTKAISASMLREIRRGGLRLAGGLADSGEPLPAELQEFRHRTVGYDRWSALSAGSRVSLMTRGLMGCVSFKSLNFLMLGSPFAANEFYSNFYEPLVAGRHYFQVREDFSDLAGIIHGVTEEQLCEMGRRNLAHWENFISPSATARYMLGQAGISL